MESNLAPCKDCPDRVVGCHSECARYADFKTEIERVNNNRREATKGIYEAVDMRKQRVTRTKKRKGEKKGW